MVSETCLVFLSRSRGSNVGFFSSCKKHRFATPEEQAVAKAHDSATPQNMQYANKFWLRVFDLFCVQTGRVVCLRKWSQKELDECLSRLYVGLGNKNGEEYKKASYHACRAVLSRLLVASCVKKSETSSGFSLSNLQTPPWTAF